MAGKLTIVCGWCGKNLGSSKEPSIDGDMTSHGMCDSCSKKMKDDAKDYMKASGGKK